MSAGLPLSLRLLYIFHWFKDTSFPNSNSATLRQTSSAGFSSPASFPLRTRSSIFPLFIQYILSRERLSAPSRLHPIGLEFIRDDSTWLTEPSVLLPRTASDCISLSNCSSGSSSLHSVLFP